MTVHSKVVKFSLKYCNDPFFASLFHLSYCRYRLFRSTLSRYSFPAESDVCRNWWVFFSWYLKILFCRNSILSLFLVCIGGSRDQNFVDPVFSRINQSKLQAESFLGFALFSWREVWVTRIRLWNFIWFNRGQFGNVVSDETKNEVWVWHLFLVYGCF